MEPPDPATADLDARVARLVRSHVRSRWVLLALAVLLPLGFHLLLERQARRLDALADHGVVTDALVTQVSSTITFYTYEANGAVQSWNVAREDAPFALGERFPVVYVPEDPGLSRPGTSREVGAWAAAKNRAFGWKLERGVFAFFALFLVVGEIRLRGLRKRGRAELTDPDAYKKRVALALATLAPFALLIFSFHFADAREKGESIAPVIGGIILSVAILGGTVFFIARNGPAQAGARSARLLRYVVPIAFGIALLRLVLFLAGH